MRFKQINVKEVVEPFF